MHKTQIVNRTSRRLRIMVTAAAAAVVVVPPARAQETPKPVPDSPEVAAKAKPSPKAGKTGRPAGKRILRPALDGHCPVSYLVDGKAIKGDQKFRSLYEGRIYYLSSAEAKKKFDADPERFLPQFGGLCATVLGGSYGFRKPGNPEIFSVFRDKLYFFISERAKRSFDDVPPAFTVRAKLRFAQPGLGGYCPVSYQKRPMASKGRAGIEYFYGRWVYRFRNEEYRKLFMKDPQRYVPRYDGSCAEGLANGRRYDGDPEHYAVHKGATYIFADAKARLIFLMNPDPHIAKADEQWRKLNAQKP